MWWYNHLSHTITENMSTKGKFGTSDFMIVRWLQYLKLRCLRGVFLHLNHIIFSYWYIFFTLTKGTSTTSVPHLILVFDFKMKFWIISILFLCSSIERVKNCCRIMLLLWLVFQGGCYKPRIKFPLKSRMICKQRSLGHDTCTDACYWFHVKVCAYQCT